MNQQKVFVLKGQLQLLEKEIQSAKSGNNIQTQLDNALKILATFKLPTRQDFLFGLIRSNPGITILQALSATQETYPEMSPGGLYSTLSMAIGGTGSFTKKGKQFRKEGQKLYPIE